MNDDGAKGWNVFDGRRGASNDGLARMFGAASAEVAAVAHAPSASEILGGGAEEPLKEP
jgi:hypothetical protein